MKKQTVSQELAATHAALAGLLDRLDDKSDSPYATRQELLELAGLVAKLTGVEDDPAEAVENAAADVDSGAPPAQ